MEWISVKDRLPEIYTEVLIYPYPSEYGLTGEYTGDRWVYHEYETGFGDVTYDTWPTHWAPLLRPPTSGTE